MLPIKLTRKKREILGIIFALLFLGLVSFFAFKGKIIPEKTEEASLLFSGKLYLEDLEKMKDKVIARVGREELYGQDLKKVLEYYFYRHLEKGEISEEIRKQALEKTIEESVILQEGEKEGWLRLSEEVFNSLTKDYAQRGSLVKQAEEKIREKDLKVTEGRYVSVWFYNVEPPSIGVEKAREIAKGKLEALYPKIVSGELSFEEAGALLYQDQEVLYLTAPRLVVPSNLEYLKTPEGLKEVCKACSHYGKFYIGGEKREGTYFSQENQEIIERIKKLRKGEISEILVGKDGGYEEGQGFYEAFFIVLILDGRHNEQGQETLESWFKERRNEIPIIYY